jgi:Domain of unknown function DUF29
MMPSWRGSFARARQNVARRLRQHNLRQELPGFIVEAYADARRLAADQTGLPLSTFPERCEWNEEEVQYVEFLPNPIGEATP